MRGVGLKIEAIISYLWRCFTRKNITSLLFKATFTFLPVTSSARTYKHHCVITPHVANDAAVTLPNLAPNSPGVVAADEEEGDVTYFWKRQLLYKLIINLSWQLCSSLAINVACCCVYLEARWCSRVLATGLKQTGILCVFPFLLLPSRSRTFQ